MSQQQINIGNTANDGTGDTLRTAMGKINGNFNEYYTTVVIDATYKNATLANTLTLGTNSVSATINSTKYTGTANNSLYLAGYAGNNYVLSTDSRTLSGNLTFTGKTIAFSNGINVSNGNFIANTSGVSVNTTFTVSSLVSNTVNATSLNVSNTATIGGNLIIGGTLFVAGNTTFVNATVITTNDKYMVFSNNAATAVAALGSGIVVGTYANLVYQSTGSAWQSNVNFTPAANNISLGNTSNLWNLYSNVVSAASANISGNITIGGNMFISNTVISGNGFYSNGAFTSNAALYSDGIVVDYVTGNGRISVGPADALTVYTGNAASLTGAQIMFVANSIGLSVNGYTNATYFSVSQNTIANSTGVYTGYINSSSWSTYSNSTGFYTGNTTINTAITTAGLFVNGTATVANSTGVYTGTVNAAAFTVGTSFIANSTGVYTGTVNATAFATGNTTTGTGGSYLNNSTLLLGNNTINTTANSTSLTTNTVTINSNTFTLGTSTKAANGYTWLANGLKMNWGTVLSNSSTGDVTFTSAFTTLYNVQATSNSIAVTGSTGGFAGVTAANSTTATIRVPVAGAQVLVYYMAIGV